MAKWQPISEARFLPVGSVADLLMDDGKVLRAEWRVEPGTLGNCPGSKAEKIPCGMTAWWPFNGKWRGQKMIGLFEPLSFRLVGE